MLTSYTVPRLCNEATVRNGVGLKPGRYDSRAAWCCEKYEDMVTGARRTDRPTWGLVHPVCWPGSHVSEVHQEVGKVRIGILMLDVVGVVATIGFGKGLIVRWQIARE
jgi:hypothetical protein